jgi:hypothetical protein
MFILSKRYNLGYLHIRSELITPVFIRGPAFSAVVQRLYNHTCQTRISERLRRYTIEHQLLQETGILESPARGTLISSILA